MKLVTAPVPRPLAKRRQTTKKAWSTIGRVAARARSVKRTRTSSGTRRPPVGPQRERDQRDRERDDAVRERPPGAGDDAVLVDAPEDHGEAEHAAERVGRGRRPVAVVGGEGTRAEGREELRDGRGHEVDERLRGGLLCALREARRQLRGRPVVREDAERERRHRDDPEREPVGAEDAPEGAVLAGAREHGQDGDPHRARREHEDEEDGVGREEAVRHRIAAELARDDDADGGREAGDDGQRHRRQQPAREVLREARTLGLRHARSVRPMANDPIWTENALADLRREFGDAYGGRTVLVTGADGFMGSHLTDALVEVGADVHAFVRATSSGALNNISHLRNRLKVKFADLTDKTSIDYLVKELRDTVSDKPYVFHLGAQAHVGESWHRPYETVMANTVGTLNLLQSVVDWGLELEKFDTAGTSEEYGNVRESVAHHHDFDEAGGLILHERSPINPKSIYATAKVAADFLTMNYHDAFGVPGVVTRMFNNYGPRQNPRYVTGHDHHPGADPAGDRARRARAAARLLLLHRRRPRPPHRRREGRSRRRLRLRAGLEHLDGRLGRPDPAHGRRAGLLARRPADRHRRGPPPPGRDRRDGAAGRLREAPPRDGLGAEGVVGGGRPAHDPVVRRAPRALDRPRRLARPRAPRPRA